MTQHYSRETSGVLDSATPARNLSQNYRSKLKRMRASIVMASQADGDTIVLGELPVGAVFAYGVLNATATLGSSTLAIGKSGTPAKYRAAATFTAAIATMFGLASAADDDPLSAVERVIATIGAAALPSSGTLVIDIYYSDTV